MPRGDGVTQVFFRDPDGYVLELFQWTNDDQATPRRGSGPPLDPSALERPASAQCACRPSSDERCGSRARSGAARPRPRHRNPHPRSRRRPRCRGRGSAVRRAHPRSGGMLIAPGRCRGVGGSERVHDDEWVSALELPQSVSRSISEAPSSRRQSAWLSAPARRTQLLRGRRANSRSRPRQVISSDDAIFFSSETMDGLSPHTVATSSVIPAARASAASSRARINQRRGPGGRPRRRMRSRRPRRIDGAVRSRRRTPRRGSRRERDGSRRPARARTSSGSESRGFAPQKRFSRERSPRRSKSAATVSVSPFEQADRETVDEACVHMTGKRPTPAAASRRAIFLTWPDQARQAVGHGSGHSVLRARRPADRLLHRRDKDRRSSSAQKWVSHLEEEWDDPLARGFYEELAQNHLVVRYDRLGAGLAERQLDGPPTVEGDDVLRAVLDACGGVPATVFACSCCTRGDREPGTQPGAGGEDRLLRKLRLARRSAGGGAEVARRLRARQLGAGRADARGPHRAASERGSLR